MQQKIKRKLSASEAKKIQRRRDQGLRKARVYLASVTIQLRPDVPATLEEFLEQHEYRRTTGYWAHCRHALTNYNDICKEMTRRFPNIFWNLPMEHYELKVQAGKVVGEYLRSIGYFDWKESRRR